MTKLDCDHANGDSVHSIAYTDEDAFRGYIPRGWTKRPGYTLDGGNSVMYDAIPIYSNLYWNTGSKCRGAGDAFTGINASFDNGVYGYYSHGGKSFRIMEDWTRGTSYRHESWDGKPVPPPKLPIPWMACKNCKRKIIGDDECTALGPTSQVLCGAGKLEKNPRAAKSCESIGVVSSEEAHVVSYDANGSLMLVHFNKEEGEAAINKDTQFNPTVRTSDPIFLKDDGGQAMLYGHTICRYPSNALREAKHVVELFEKVKKDLVPSNQQFIGPLMESFCKKRSMSGCIERQFAAPSSKFSGGHCTNYMAKGEEGELCRRWLDSVATAELANDVKLPKTYTQITSELCSGGADSEWTWKECDCLYRSSNVTYSELMKMDWAKTSPACWFRPCRGALQSGSIVPIDMVNIVRNNQCPNQICMSIIQLIDSNQNKFGDVNNDISCNLNQNTDGSSDGTGNGTGPGTVRNDSSSSSSGGSTGDTKEIYSSYIPETLREQWYMWFLFVLVLVAILFMVKMLRKQ